MVTMCNAEGIATLMYVSVDVDECASGPCLNDGTCTDDVNGYDCSCTTAYTGNHCEGKANFCFAQNELDSKLQAFDRKEHTQRYQLVHHMSCFCDVSSTSYAVGIEYCTSSGWTEFRVV